MQTLQMTNKEFEQSKFFDKSIYKGLVWEGDFCFAQYTYKSNSFQYKILVK